MMNTARYNRQIILSGFGTEAQEKLSLSKVLVIGAGGLGCPVLQFLAAAGVGTIGIVDFDMVDKSNLHRQILFDEKAVGKLKSLAAKERLHKMNSEIKIISYPNRLINQNIFPLLEKYDIVVDCTDNFQVRYLLNDACNLENKPLVYGAIYQYEGQVSVFNVEKKGMKTNYRDLFPQPPQPNEVPNCNEAGVLGTLSGMIGTIQAQEVIKLITEIGEPLVHKLFLMNILNYETRIFGYKKSDMDSSPKTKEDFLRMDYEEICGFSSPYHEIGNNKQLEAILKQKNAILVDVRNEDELPKIPNFAHTIIPLSVLEEQIDRLEEFNPIIFVCRLGVRSIRAVQIAKERYPEKEIKNVRNGIETIL